MLDIHYTWGFAPVCCELLVAEMEDKLSACLLIISILNLFFIGLFILLSILAFRKIKTAGQGGSTGIVNYIFLGVMTTVGVLQARCLLHLIYTSKRALEGTYLIVSNLKQVRRPYSGLTCTMEDMVNKGS